MLMKVKSMKAKRHAIEAFHRNPKATCPADVVDKQTFADCQAMIITDLEATCRALDQDIRVKEQRIDKEKERIDAKEAELKGEHADKVPAQWSPHNLPSHKSIVVATESPALAFDLVKLPDGAEWSTTESKDALTIRKPHYDKLWGRVHDASRRPKPYQRAVLISGNPGIGKTWSLEYLLLRSLEEAPDRLVFVVGRTFYSLYDNRNVVRFARNYSDSLKQIVNSATRMYTQNKEILILHDIKDERTLAYSPEHVDLLTRVGFRATVVVAASPQKDNTKDFEKDFFEYAFFCMPMWSLTEAVDYCQHFKNKLEEETKNAFYHVGGAPRVMMRFFSPKNGVLSDQAKDISKITLKAFWNPQNTPDNELSKVVGFFPTSDYTSYSVDFVSLYAREQWHKVHVSEEGAMLVELEQRDMRDALGRFFKLAVGRRLRTEGLCFERLPDVKGKGSAGLQHWPGTGGTVTEEEFYGNDLRKVLVPHRGKKTDGGNRRKAASAENDGADGFRMPDSVLHVPRNSDLPAGDFFFEQPDGVWVVQVTVAKDKTPSPPYETLLEQLRDCKKKVLGIVWVVSVDGNPENRVRISAKLRMDEKKFPLFHCTPQYVCRVDYRKNMQWAMDVTVKRAPRVVWFHTKDRVPDTDTDAREALTKSSPVTIKKKKS